MAILHFAVTAGILAILIVVHSIVSQISGFALHGIDQKGLRITKRSGTVDGEKASSSTRTRWSDETLANKSGAPTSYVTLPVSTNTEPVTGNDALQQPQPPSDPCEGKERLIEILSSAGDKRARSRCAKLPTWKEVQNLYGSEAPIVHGLDTCERYRELLSAEANNGTRVEPLLRVAGLYNSGTNALDHTLNSNMESLAKHHHHEVPWGKHVSPALKWVNRYPADNEVSKKHVLPIVLVRDPYRWMQSMVSRFRCLLSCRVFLSGFLTSQSL
jgi:hypothetical protein